MSSFTITTVTAPSTPFELVSGLWHGFIGLKPFADFKRSRQRPGVRDGRLDLTHMTNIVALGNWLAQLQASMNRHGLCVSELVLVLWVLQCLEPGTRSFLERSLATEQEPEKVGFNTLKLHLEVWARVLTTREHRRHWNKVTQGSVDLVEFWAGQGAQKHAELVRRWKHAWGVLSGEHGMSIRFAHCIRDVLTWSRVDVRMTEAPRLW